MTRLRSGHYKVKGILTLPFLVLRTPSLVVRDHARFFVQQRDSRLHLLGAVDLPSRAIGRRRRPLAECSRSLAVSRTRRRNEPGLGPDVFVALFLLPFVIGGSLQRRCPRRLDDDRFRLAVSALLNHKAVLLRVLLHELIGVVRVMPEVVDHFVEEEGGQQPYDDVECEQRADVDGAAGELNGRMSKVLDAD